MSKDNFKLMIKSSLIIKIIAVMLSFINTIIINRFLGVELRGEYTFILNSANLVHLILNLGIGYSYSYFCKEKYENVKQIFSKIIYYQFILYLIVFFILNCFIKSTSNKIIIFFSIILTLNLQISFITMVEDIVKRNIILLKCSVMYTTLLTIIFMCIRVKNINVILIITSLKYFVEIFYLSRNFNLFSYLKSNCKIEINTVKKILKAGAPTMIMTILISINYNIDVLILKYLSNNYEVGLYGVAVTLANMVWIIPDAFKEVILNKSAKNDCVREVVVSIYINFFICIFIIVGFALLGKSFIRIIYGREYVESFCIILLLFIGTIPMIIYKLIHPIYLSNGKQYLVMNILLISAIINIVFNFLIIPNWGAVGAAIASVFSYAICGIIFWVKFKRDYKFNSILIVKELTNNINNN